MVERDLAKVDVAGSTPVSRSRYFDEPRVGGAFRSPQAYESVDYLGRYG